MREKGDLNFSSLCGFFEEGVDSIFVKGDYLDSCNTGTKKKFECWFVDRGIMMSELGLESRVLEVIAT